MGNPPSRGTGAPDGFATPTPYLQYGESNTAALELNDLNEAQMMDIAAFLSAASNLHSLKVVLDAYDDVGYANVPEISLCAILTKYRKCLLSIRYEVSYVDGENANGCAGKWAGRRMEEAHESMSTS